MWPLLALLTITIGGLGDYEFFIERTEQAEASGELERESEGGSPETDETGDGKRPKQIDRKGSMADRVSYCESGNKNVKNPTSSASGYFQFIDSTWVWVTGLAPPARAYSYDTQLAAFHTLWDEGRGASHWEPSRYCWQYDSPWDHYSR